MQKDGLSERDVDGLFGLAISLLGPTFLLCSLARVQEKFEVFAQVGVAPCNKTIRPTGVSFPLDDGFALLVCTESWAGH